MRYLLVVIVGVGAFFVGCTAEQITAAESQLYDPSSITQQAVDTAGAVIEATKPLLPVIAGLPFGQWITSGIAVVSVIVNALQALKAKKQKTAIVELVQGGQLFKQRAEPEAVNLFKRAQAEAQSTSTKLMVAEAKIA